MEVVCPENFAVSEKLKNQLILYSKMDCEIIVLA